MRIALPLLLLLLACKKDAATSVDPPLKPVEPVEAPPVEAPPPAPAPPVAAPAGVDAMVTALSVRDQGPTCADVEAKAEAPVEALLHIVEHVAMPPQAPMRAATCLVDRHPEDVRETLIGWTKDEKTLGLARLVLQRLDTLPEDIAVDVARVAVTGPLGEEAVEAVRGAKREAVRMAAPQP